MYLKNHGKQCHLKLISIIMAIIVSILCYIWMSYNYDHKKICMVKGSYVVVSLLYFFACILLMVRLLKPHFFFIKKVWVNIVYMLFVPFAAIYMEELIWNDKISEITAPVFLLNYILVLVPTVAMIFIFQNTMIAYISIMILCWLYGIVNYYVLEFKGCPPSFGDLLAANTAISVMGQYKFWLSDSVIYGTLLLLYSMIVFAYVSPIRICDGKKEKKVLMSVCGLIGLILAESGIYHFDLQRNLGLYVNSFVPTVSFIENGAPVTLLISAQNMKIDKPNGYSQTNAENILERYDSNEKLLESERPTIIVIMNESFSDFGVLGEFDTDEYLLNWKSMNSYIMHGYTYVSVNGGNTCNSEFEFLTGNSMANLDAGITPYYMLDLSDTFNLAAVFSELGYETIAMHPGLTDSWNRDRVYKSFGFDEYIAIEDMENVRYLNWASDEYNYEQLIYAYENRSAPLFLFNVTIQNHGGYETPLHDKIELVSVENKYHQYGDVVNYLTLIKESDRAFHNLLEYFSRQEEPVVVCMFGDHQPKINENFIASLISANSVEEEEKRYMTPYVIWSNFDMQAAVKDCDMSANYLGANLLNILGIHTEYTDYLLDLQKEIPIINQVGYQTADGIWHESWEENDRMNEYKIVQYYQLFGK